jgi:hypothetical protein
LLQPKNLQKTSTKMQIDSNFKITMTEADRSSKQTMMLQVLNFGHWILFGICFFRHKTIWIFALIYCHPTRLNIERRPDVISRLSTQTTAPERWVAEHDP